MNKLMTVGMAAVMAVGVVKAQDDVVMVGSIPQTDPAETQVTLEAALVSSHVWRGQVLNNDFVFQPQLTAAQYGLSLNVWGNYDIGENYIGIKSDTSEIDFSLAYTLPLDINEVAFDIGFINYHYPANAGGLNGAGANSKSTTELFAKGTVLSWKDYVIPSMTVFGDFDKADGVYVLFDVMGTYDISDYLWLAGGVSAGWGNTSYNDYYWGNPVTGTALDANFNDFNFYGSCTYEIMEGLYTSISLQYTMLNGGQIKDAGKARYEAAEKVFGGVNIAYDF